MMSAVADDNSAETRGGKGKGERTVMDRSMSDAGTNIKVVYLGRRVVVLAKLVMFGVILGVRGV